MGPRAIKDFNFTRIFKVFTKLPESRRFAVPACYYVKSMIASFKPNQMFNFCSTVYVQKVFNSGLQKWSNNGAVVVSVCAVSES